MIGYPNSAIQSVPNVSIAHCSAAIAMTALLALVAIRYVFEGGK